MKLGLSDRRFHGLLAHPLVLRLSHTAPQTDSRTDDTSPTSDKPGIRSPVRALQWEWTISSENIQVALARIWPTRLSLNPTNEIVGQRSHNPNPPMALPTPHHTFAHSLIYTYGAANSMIQ